MSDHDVVPFHPAVSGLLAEIYQQNRVTLLSSPQLAAWRNTVVASAGRTTIGQQLVALMLPLWGKPASTQLVAQLVVLAAAALGQSQLTSSLQRGGLDSAKAKKLVASVENVGVDSGIAPRAKKGKAAVRAKR
jgi:hypothetical protein